MLLNQLQIKTLQGIIIVMTIIILGLVIWCTKLSLDKKNLEIEIAQLKAENKTKTENMQQVADSISKSFEKVKETKNVETKIIEREIVKEASQHPEVFRVECITDRTLELLQPLYLARNASEPEAANSSSNTSREQNRGSTDQGTD